jgi:hypothetical protein
MKGLEWGRLYEEHHGKSYDPNKMSEEVKKLAADDAVTSRKGIFEYLLGGSVDTKLLEVRVFDKKVARTHMRSRRRQSRARASRTARSAHWGTARTKSRIYKFDEMDADHVAAWSKGGDSSAKNCQMLCITHNRGQR